MEINYNPCNHGVIIHDATKLSFVFYFYLFFLVFFEKMKIEKGNLCSYNQTGYVVFLRKLPGDSVFLYFYGKRVSKSSNFGSSQQRYSIKISVFFHKHFVKFKEKHLCQSLFGIKLQASSLEFYEERDSSTDIFL